MQSTTPTRQVQIGSHFRYQSAMPTAAVFQMQAQHTAQVSLADEVLEWNGPQPAHEFVDHHGNRCIRVTLPVGESVLSWGAVATVPDADDLQAAPGTPQTLPEDLPDDLLVYTLPSRFCESDKLSNQAWQHFGSVPPSIDRVMEIMDFVHSHLAYTTGSSDSTTSAVDVYASGKGVCRDFAHLMVTLCRAMNLPSRYAFGYFPDMDWTPPEPIPMDFHAWTQVWLDGRWYDFDARHNIFRKGRILVSTGRDAADTALVTTYGGPRLQEMIVTADEIVPD